MTTLHPNQLALFAGLDRDGVANAFRIALSEGPAPLRANYVDELYKLLRVQELVDTNWLRQDATTVFFLTREHARLNVLLAPGSPAPYAGASAIARGVALPSPPPPAPPASPASPASPVVAVVAIPGESFHLVLDQSSSMYSMHNEAYEGAKRMIRELPEQSSVTFTTFSTDVVLGQRRTPAETLAHLAERVAQGSTALYDAIAAVVEFELREPREKCTVVVVTDGHDTSSRTVDALQVREHVDSFQARAGWRILFVGSNQDAIAVARGFGIPPDRALTYGGRDGAQMIRAMRAASENATRFRTTGTDAFTSVERTQSVQTQAR